jgi:hypothetical protein
MRCLGCGCYGLKDILAAWALIDRSSAKLQVTSNLVVEFILLVPLI